MYRRFVLIIAILVIALSAAPAFSGSAACANRNNNTFAKLLECVMLAGVREHHDR